MSDKSNISANTSTFSKNMDTDNQRFYTDTKEWSFARNATVFSQRGDLGDISNEKATLYMNSAPYPIIGGIYIRDCEWCIFSTSAEYDGDSEGKCEIGLFNEKTFEYTTLISDNEGKCLNFDVEHLVKGVSRIDAKCHRIVYWDDGKNPSRRLDIDDIPWVTTVNETNDCRIENILYDTNGNRTLNCDKIRLSPVFKDLSFRCKVNDGAGEMLNGTYFVYGAYLVDRQRVSDYSLPSNQVTIFNHMGMGGSIEIEVTEADSDAYEEFELNIFRFVNMNTSAKKLGVYSTRQKKIVIDRIDESLEFVDHAALLVRNDIPDHTDAIVKFDDYILRLSPTYKFKFNYQPQANKIKAHWVCVEHNADYYGNGGTDVGYMRDEVYSFFIRFIYNTGDRSDSYHIPGRVAENNDTRQIPSIYDNSQIPNWELNNTATLDLEDRYGLIGKYLDNKGELIDEAPDDGFDYGKIVAIGDMGYWESSEHYPDNNEERWADLCGKPIRHHKFPANSINGNDITNHYVDGGNKIRVMGVYFSNIEYPKKFNNGTNDDGPVDGIVGYEILRGSRTGNRTVIAKGMLNNMRQYKWINPNDPDDTDERFYPNYPYNAQHGDCSSDHYLSSEQTHSYNSSIGRRSIEALVDIQHAVSPHSTVTGDLLGEVHGGNVSRTMFTFHSPDTSFRHPFLSAKELCVYGEMFGKMRATFKVPDGHPKHKLISDRAFFIAAILSFGHAIEKLEGKVIEINEAATIDYGGTTAGGGTMVATTGLFGLSAPASFVQIIAHLGKAIFKKAVKGLVNNATLGFNMVGLSSTEIGEGMNNIVEGAAASTGSPGGHNKIEVEKSAWQRMPFVMRMLTGFSSFMIYWGEGIDQILKIIYTFVPYRQYALQQYSHGYYKNFKAIDTIHKKVEESLYITPNICSMGADTIVNNLKRSTTVGLKISNELSSTEHVDDSQFTMFEVCDRVDPLTNQLYDYNKAIEGDGYVARPKSIASYYVALKQRLKNQYGQLDNIIQQPISCDWHDIDSDNYNSSTFTSPVLFGGDIYIGRYTEKNTMPFFYNWLDGQPDGTIFNYRMYSNVPYPRFWMDTDPFDVSELFDTEGAGDNNQSFDIFRCDDRDNSNNASNTEEDCACGFKYGTDDLQPFLFGRTSMMTVNEYYEYTNTAPSGPPTGDDVHANNENDCYYKNKTEKLFKNYKKEYERLVRLELVVEMLENMVEFVASGGNLTIPQAIPSPDESDDENNSVADMNPLCPHVWSVEGGWPYVGILSETVAITVERDTSSSGDYVKINTISFNGLEPVLDNISDPAIFFNRGIWCDEFPSNRIFTNNNTPKTWANTQNPANKYVEDDKGKWARVIRRQKRKIEGQQKTLNKLAEKMRKKTEGRNRSGHNPLSQLISFPSSKYALDGKVETLGSDIGIAAFNPLGMFRVTVKHAVMYLFVSGVRDFFVESEVNIDNRDWGDNDGERFYDHRRYTDLNSLFKTKFIDKGNYYKYDWSLSVNRHFLNFNTFGRIQKRDYDIDTYYNCLTKIPQRMLYSLRQVSESLIDNWRVFLNLNYHDFSSRLVNVKDLGNTTMIVFQSNDAPVMVQNTSELKTSGGTSITVGDGSMFNQRPQSLLSADNVHERGSCQNFYSVVYTPAGLYWIGQNENKIYTSTGNVTPISDGLMKSWFDNYTKFKLTEKDQIPEFELTDNPVAGIGFQTIFDNESSTIYFCKRDFVLTDYAKELLRSGEFKYDGGSRFKHGGAMIHLDNKKYFEDASWTISYSPVSKAFISFHDWHPRLCFGSRNTFMTTESVMKRKDDIDITQHELEMYYGTNSRNINTKWNSIWKHNERVDGFCNFYGKDFPFEVEIPIITKGNVTTVKDVTYYMEVYVYGENGYDRYHVLDFNFDEAIVYNSEQCSGLLHLNLKRKNDPRCLIQYPEINGDKIEILFSKEEQRYRFNQFYDIVKDRGEFDAYVGDKVKQGISAVDEFDGTIVQPIFNYKPNGYEKEINPDAVDYNKAPYEHKRFRHYKNSVLLRRTVSKDRNMVLSIVNNIDLNSFR